MAMKLSEFPSAWLEEIIHLTNERFVIVNRNGEILYLSQKYCEFLNTTLEAAVGKPVSEVIENSRMQIVAKTGKEEISDIQEINGSVMVASRYPLFVNGELVGALGTVVFPTPDNLREYINKIQLLVTELNYYRTKDGHRAKGKVTFANLVGESPLFLESKKLAEKVSNSDSSILITGESGTGKELFAHAIHNRSLRANFPFVPINCAAIPEELFESELFGYYEGAFTGAKRGGKKGFFEIANHGTIFLDEIGDLPFSMQSKLLRVLQEGEIQPVGAQKRIPIDVRIIAATNKDLSEMVKNSSFRQDLYYRLNVIHIEIPPLRKRKEDIQLIANHLLRKLEKIFYRKGVTFSEEVVKVLKNHTWPGNVRELENVLERAINVLDGNRIEVVHLPLYLRDVISKENREIIVDEQIIEPLKETIAKSEKQAIIKALKVAKGNKLEAAKLLGISKTTFYDKYKMYFS